MSATDCEGSIADRDHGAVGQAPTSLTLRCARSAPRSTLRCNLRPTLRGIASGDAPQDEGMSGGEPLLMRQSVGLIDGELGFHQRKKALGVGAATKEAGTMAGGKRGHLVKEKKRRVAIAHRFMMVVLEVKLAADPMVRGPAAPSERLVFAMKLAAAIAHHGAARRGRDDFAG